MVRKKYEKSKRGFKQTSEAFLNQFEILGGKGVDRKVMYPFITQNNSKKGYYIFEGAIYILEY